MNSSLKNGLLARIVRRLLRPRWLATMKGRAQLRRSSPTSTIHRRADADGCVKLGRFVLVDAGAWIYESEIGNYSYIADGARVAQTKMGRFCSIGPMAYVGLPQHPSKGFISSHPLFYQRIPWRGFDYADRDYFEGFTPTQVGNDVWIGANAMIKGGVKIGDGAIIGAGSVVTKDVPPYAIWVGVPARLLRYRFDAETIKFLLEFSWWDKEEKWLREHWLKFHNSDEFLKTFGVVVPSVSDSLLSKGLGIILTWTIFWEATHITSLTGV
jgi:acetyltransferase-like isoleucine patch superfamily enzyme